MQCRNCTGNEFKKTPTGNYKCQYCGTLYYEEKIKTRGKNNQKRIYAISAAAAVSILSAFIIYLASFSGNDEAFSSKSDESSGTHYVFNNTDSLPEPSGEITSIYKIPDTIGNMYFLAIYKNTGQVALRKPQITVRLFSKSNEKIATGTGYGFKKNLNPGEETPVYILIKNCPQFTRFESVHKPEYPYVIPEDGIFKNLFNAEISGTVIKPGKMANSYVLKGKIYNRTSGIAEFVQVAVVLYNKENEAIKYGSTYISEKNLEPGDYDYFQINFYTVQGVPDNYKIYYDGNLQ